MVTLQTTSLDPEVMNAALDAFEMAWAAVIAVPDACETNLARELLSKGIIKAALENGERDSDRLKAYALREIET
jgi:hypothetical protein